MKTYRVWLENAQHYNNRSFIVVNKEDVTYSNNPQLSLCIGACHKNIELEFYGGKHTKKSLAKLAKIEKGLALIREQLENQ